jgi:hypothetical protein
MWLEYRRCYAGLVRPGVPGEHPLAGVTRHSQHTGIRDGAIRLRIAVFCRTNRYGHIIYVTGLFDSPKLHLLAGLAAAASSHFSLPALA